MPLSHLASEEGDKTVWEEVERRSNAGCCTEVQLGGGDIFEPCLGESECPFVGFRCSWWFTAKDTVLSIHPWKDLAY